MALYSNEEIQTIVRGTRIHGKVKPLKIFFWKTVNFFAFSVAIDLVEQRIITYKNSKDQRIGSKPLLEEYLRNDNIDRKDITGMAGDLLLGGIDTVTKN